MPLDLDHNSSTYQIRAYQSGHVLINDTHYYQSLLISKNQLIYPWRPQHIEELQSEDLQRVLELTPEIILLGTGKQLIFPAIQIYGFLFNEKIGIEIMDTAAACRTFAALTSENRHVAAALIL